MVVVRHPPPNPRSQESDKLGKRIIDLWDLESDYYLHTYLQERDLCARGPLLLLLPSISMYQYTLICFTHVRCPVVRKIADLKFAPPSCAPTLMKKYWNQNTG